MLQGLGAPVRALGVAFAALALAGAPASAQDSKLPKTLTFTAYDTGTSGFNITVGLGKALKEKGAELRVLPAGNDVARLAPIKAGRAQAASMGTGTFFAMEGLYEFGSREWGPQPAMMMLSSMDCNGANLGVAADTGVKEMKDLKGKRVGFVVGSPALNQNALAMLAFAGLGKADIVPVEFASYGAMWKGVVNNDVDAAFASTITGPAKEVETSPRGLMWPALPHADTAGWNRVLKVGPFFTRHKATCGAAGLSPQTPKEMANYPYPAYTVYASLDADVAYAITKALIDGYDLYKDAVPGASGLGIKVQVKDWVLPFHPGVIKAYKEAGHWTDKDQAHTDKLLARQKVLAEAWAGYLKTNPPEDKAKFYEGWLAARKAGLVKASMDPIVD